METTANKSLVIGLTQQMREVIIPLMTRICFRLPERISSVLIRKRLAFTHPRGLQSSVGSCLWVQQRALRRGQQRRQKAAARWQSGWTLQWLRKAECHCRTDGCPEQETGSVGEDSREPFSKNIICWLLNPEQMLQRSTRDWVLNICPLHHQ